jgi:hypothetical protein
MRKHPHCSNVVGRIYPEKGAHQMESPNYLLDVRILCMVNKITKEHNLSEEETDRLAGELDATFQECFEEVWVSEVPDPNAPMSL